MSDSILIARPAGDSARDIRLLPRMANRHGLVAGATGTGKTVTLQRMAEGFSRIGVPVFLADVKGDLAGLAQPGGAHPRIAQRLAELGIAEFRHEGCPVALWDVWGEQGHPVRATVSELGPLLLGELLDLNETQRGVLTLVFRVADDEGLLLLDLKDLRAMLAWAGENAKRLTTRYGNVPAASIGAIQRGLLALEAQGAGHFFAEPALDIRDLMRTDAGGRGLISILAAERLMRAPKLYATLLLWLLSELFEELPEIGDPEKPRLVFFFDEAHLLFDDAPAALLEKIEQVVRLIRSKGVGVYFVTQNPLDVPDAVLGQLGNRVQHALRAFTPRDQKAVRAAASTMRANPAFDVGAAITELGVGEALVSLLDEQGRPGIVERALVVPPHSRLGPLDAAERAALLAGSALAGRYERSVDRESAHEMLAARLTPAEPAADSPAPRRAPRAGADPPREPAVRRGATRGGRSDSVVEAAAKSVVRSLGTQLGREIVRGVLGSIFGGRGRR